MRGAKKISWEGGLPWSRQAKKLGVTRGVLYSRSVARFYYCDKINLLETTTGFTVLLVIHLKSNTKMQILEDKIF